MKMWRDKLIPLAQRTVTGTALFLAGLLAVVILIVGTGSIMIGALNTLDPINLVQDVDFGIVIPGEDYPDNFDICIKDPASGDHVDYILLLTEKPLDPGPGNFPDMRPFLVVAATGEFDPVANGPTGDYQAEGDLDSPGDECDSWQVTLTAPHCEDAHNPYTDPQGSDATIPCQVDQPTDNPQDWSEGSDLGAQMEINVTVSRQ